jgi:hypothetical protein
VSVPVAIEQLRDQTDSFGPAPYLLTVSDDGNPHAVSVTVAWSGDTLVASVGKRTAANAGRSGSVSLLWPPYEAGGYSLIVDGEATASGGDDGGEGQSVAVHPTRAVLHRSQPDTNAGSSYSADCVRIIS